MHGLLQGERMWIEPEGFAQVHTRGNVDAHRLQQPGKWTPYGVGPMEGEVRGLPVLPAGAAGDGGKAEKKAYGPGEEPRPREGEPTGSAHGELL